MRILLLFWLAAPALCGAYSNLIATSDGKAVYFQVPTGPVSFTWYVARQGSGELSVTAANAPLADVDGTGSVLASAATEPRFCGFAGSSCWLANSCEAVFQLQGPGFQYSSNGADTFVRLSRSGQFAWIVQGWCGGVGWPPPSPMLNGLAARRGLRVSSVDLKIEHRAVGGEAGEALGLAPIAKATTISRTLVANGAPVAVMFDVVHPNIKLPGEPELQAG